MAKPKIDEKKLLHKGPDLDKYLDGKKRYTTYSLGARMYSLNYYTFMKLVKQAGANIRIRKNVVIDLDILEKYMDEHCGKEGEEEDV